MASCQGYATVRRLFKSRAAEYSLAHCTTKNLRNILTIDVEEYFQVSAFSEYIPRSQWDRFQTRVEGSTHTILDRMSLSGVKGTFFVLGWVAEKYPQIVRAIRSEGHEVACHGYSHCLVYEQTPKEFREETHRAKTILEQTAGCQVFSYRAASYSITKQSAWALQILAEEGFENDSSIFPIVHDRYGISSALRWPAVLQLEGGFSLTEFPMSTLNRYGLNIPISGGGYFRFFPYSVTRAAIRSLNRVDNLPLVFYLHPWEFDPEQPRQHVGRVSRFRHYLNLHKTEPRFVRLIKDFDFAPLATVGRSLMLPRMSLNAFIGNQRGITN